MLLLASLLGLCVFVSAFFSASETAMMAVNRYRMSHLAKKSNAAKRILKMLVKPQKVLGAVLIGNTISNIAAPVLMTMLIQSVSNDGSYVVYGTIGLTVIILLFSEMIPKTIAAHFPERIALSVSAILQVISWIVTPFMYLVDGLLSAILRLIGARDHRPVVEPLNRDELKGILAQGGDLTGRDQQMLMGVLDLGRLEVSDVMVPRNQIEAIDVDQPWPDLVHHLLQLAVSEVVVYRGSIDHVLGTLNLLRVLPLLHQGSFNKNSLVYSLSPIDFVPETASVRDQFSRFQNKRSKICIIVDEYGDVKGTLALNDLIEEIIGSFSYLSQRKPGVLGAMNKKTILLDGQESVRDINRAYNISLPTEGANTLSGLVIEHLQSIPQGAVGCKIDKYRIEVLTVHKNHIQRLKLFLETE